jgi:adenosylcobinamide-GDP ribazoletransferase
MRRTLDAALATFQFLTRLPVPQPHWSEDLLGRGAVFFPLVGAVVGSGAAFLDWICRRYSVPDALRAIAVLAFLVVITGGLHEDGLADVADGIGGGSNREKTLAIMADSRIGSFGVIALTLIAVLPASRVAVTLIAAHVLCRWTSLPLAAYLPPARGNNGQGARFGAHLPGYSVPAGAALAAIIVIGLMGIKGLAPLVAAIIVTAATALYYRRRIGGITGDCMGATNQLTEITIYACAALAHY